MSTKTKKIIVTVLIVLLCLTVAFIFMQSIPGQEESAQESLGVLELLQPILEPFVGKGNVTDHLVRKLAHLFEFSVLGLEVGSLAWLTDKRKTVYGILFGLLTALTDETIQIFTGRGSQVQDVWLDFAGVCLGVLASAVLFALLSRLKKQ